MKFKKKLLLIESLDFLINNLLIKFRQNHEFLKL